MSTDLYSMGRTTVGTATTTGQIGFLVRLDTCGACDRLRGSWTCGVDGTFLVAAAARDDGCCPLDRWPRGPDWPESPSVVRLKARRAAKPRGSLADAIKAKRDCLLCRDVPSDRIAFRSYLTSWTGYGQIAAWLGRGLEAEGIPFGYVDLYQDPKYLGREPFVEARTYKGVTPGGPILQLAVPFLPVPDAGRTVVFTMWETTRISTEAVACLNRAVAVIVPCAYNRDGLRASGVTVPIHVIPLGVDHDTFSPQARPDSKPFTFGMAGRMAHGGIRKGINEGMAAFVRAFDRREDVRLEVKVFEDCRGALTIPDDPRIVIDTTPMRPEAMAAWYAGIDALLVPSKGEGWGMHTAESLACGRPVIATVYSGTAAFVTPDCCLPLDYHEEPAGEFYTGLGHWGVPTEDSMIAQLRWAYQNPETMRTMGAAGAIRMQDFPWSRTGRELAAVLRTTGLVPKDL